MRLVADQANVSAEAAFKMVKVRSAAPVPKQDQVGETAWYGPQPVQLLRLWAGFTVVAVYGLLFVRALVLQFIDGDDAASVAFHSAGRDSDLLRPFSSYHAGADLLLSVLPASEPTLRVSAILGSALCTVVAVLLIFELVRAWLTGTPRLYLKLLDASPMIVVLITLALLAAAPELLFLSLVYLPSMIGLSFVLVAHRLARRAVDASGWSLFALMAPACALTGFGVGIRWDLGLVAVVGVADLAFTAFRLSHMRRAVAISAIWGLGSMIAFGLVLIASPTAPAFGEVLTVLGDRAGVRPSLTGAIANSIALMTPGLIILCLGGLYALESRWRVFVGCHLLTAAALVAVLNWSVPKGFVAFLPAVFLAVLAGILELWRRWGGAVAAAVLVPLLLIPWVVGIRVPPTGDIAWGPGFEIQSADRITDDRPPSLTIGAGLALPTPEGPRSLWGFGAVLFGSSWADLAQERTDDRTAAIRYGIEQELPLVQLQGSAGLTITSLASMGIDPLRPAADFGDYSIQEFNYEPSILLVDLDSFDDFADNISVVDGIATGTGSEKVVVFGYSSTLRTVYETAPAAIQPLGPETAVIDLAQYRVTMLEPDPPADD